MQLNLSLKEDCCPLRRYREVILLYMSVIERVSIETIQVKIHWTYIWTLSYGLLIEVSIKSGFTAYNINKCFDS